MKKYQIYCTTENTWHHVASNNTLSKCPIDDGHTIDSNSIAIVNDNYIYKDGDMTELSLVEYKQLKNSLIDNKTQELIHNNGFAFDSKNFSMSTDAQANWIGLKSMEALLTFPVEITTSTDEAYSLTQANLNAFCGTALATKQAHLDSGRAIKIQVNTCTTEIEIDAVEDNR